MKNKKLITSLLMISSLLCSCNNNELSFNNIKEVVSTYSETTSYKTYSYSGNINLLNNGYDYSVNKSNQEYDISSTSYYLNLPTHLKLSTLESSEDVTGDYDTIINKFTTTDSIDTVHVYKNDIGGLSFYTFKINKKLYIKTKDGNININCTAKWNCEIRYDNDGYLVYEKFESLNAHKEDDSLSVYGLCNYTYYK